jgi:predicted RNA-binding protein with PUA-like domain
VWDGVSNPVACRNLATIRKGDTVVVYHTGDEKSAVGIATAASDAYPDPKLGNPKRPVVDLVPERPLAKPVSLAQVKSDAVLKGTELARLPRLSVIPFSESQYQRLLKLAGG